MKRLLALVLVLTFMITGCSSSESVKEITADSKEMATDLQETKTVYIGEFQNVVYDMYIINTDNYNGIDADYLMEVAAADSEYSTLREVTLYRGHKEEYEQQTKELDEKGVVPPLVTITFKEGSKYSCENYEYDSDLKEVKFKGWFENAEIVETKNLNKENGIYSLIDENQKGYIRVRYGRWDWDIYQLVIIEN